MTNAHAPGTDVCLIGAGPAGLMAAIHAAGRGAATTVVEANAHAGHKLLVTGGGRCNFTHVATADELVRAFGQAGRFLRHSFHELSPAALRDFFAAHGLADRVEPDGCVFPATDRAGDIRDILTAEATRRGVRFCYDRPAEAVTAVPGGFLIRAGQEPLRARTVVLATGGLSWPQTGSTGDGYYFAKTLGHTIVAPRPSLVPLVTREPWPGELAGVSVADVALRATLAGRKIVTRGALVFTQDGLGGPAAQDLSRFLTDALPSRTAAIAVRLDLAPNSDETELDRRVQAYLAAGARKALANVLADFVPRRLAVVLCRLTGCDADLQAGQLPKDRRRSLVSALKALVVTVTGTGPLAQAIVTRGGVATGEIAPTTMASKLCPGLFFAGEVIDVDGPCGGYNLQMCFSTGALAGRSAADALRPCDPAQP